VGRELSGADRRQHTIFDNSRNIRLILDIRANFFNVINKVHYNLFNHPILDCRKPNILREAGPFNCK
jgi:hypothetical protein